MAAAINIAAANLGGSGSAATVTFSAVPGYIVASFASRSGGSTPTLNAPTVNGNAMTALGTEYSNGSGNRMRLYGYTQSATESVTVVGSLDANFYLKGLNVKLWTGSTASPVSNIGGVNSSGSSISATVSSATGDVVVFDIEDVDSRTLTPGSGSTSVTGTGLNSTYQWSLTEAGAASVNIGGSYPSTTDAWGLAYSVASAVPSDLTGSFTLDDFTFSGAFATGALSQLAGSITLDDFALSGFLGLAPGRIDTQPFKNWSGTLLPGVTVPNVVFLKLDRTLPLALVNQVTAGDGVMTITNAALTTGTYYVMVCFDATGANIGAELVLAT